MLLRSYAKLNLYLNLISKNEQGYHLLDSLFSYVDLYDELEVIELTGQEHEIEANYELVKEDNLIYKALRLFLQSYNLKKYFKITHHKNIPNKILDSANYIIYNSYNPIMNWDIYDEHSKKFQSVLRINDLLKNVKKRKY